MTTLLGCMDEELGCTTLDQCPHHYHHSIQVFHSEILCTYNCPKMFYTAQEIMPIFRLHLLKSLNMTLSFCGDRYILSKFQLWKTFWKYVTDNFFQSFVNVMYKDSNSFITPIINYFSVLLWVLWHVSDTTYYTCRFDCCHSSTYAK